MAKSLKEILSGVKSSKIEPGSTGDEPGVDYAPKAPAEQDFVKKHKTEKHADRVGNGDDVYNATNVKHSQIKDAKHGYKNPEDKKVNEAASCNMTNEGTHCPVHEMANCSSSKKTLKEVITKKTPAGEVIKDFQKSDNPKFAGKSPEKRKQMALAAYYAKQRNEEVDESLAVPLLGAAGDDDESAEMAKTQLRALANKALHLAMQLSDDQVVEPWVQAKIAVAKDNVTAVHDYMIYGNKDSKKEQSAPYDGGIDMSGAPRNTFPSFSADVNTGRNV
jgi:hypothetical protein